MAIRKTGANTRQLLQAKKNKDDEFYTPYSTVKIIISEYLDDLRGKIIYCNCDTEQSNFVKYFKDNKDAINYKELYYTGLTDKFVFGDYLVGDFRSEESVKLLKKCDVVITNPPFSLLSEYYQLLKKYEKKFIILAPKTFTILKSVRNDFINQKIFINLSGRRAYDRNFIRPDGSLKPMDCHPVTNIKKIKYSYKDTTHKVYLKDCNYRFYDKTSILAITDAERIPVDYDGLFTLSINQCWHFDYSKYELICFTNDYNPKLLIDGKEQFVRLLCKKLDCIPSETSKQQTY